jgi:hypothetical protein
VIVLLPDPQTPHIKHKSAPNLAGARGIKKIYLTIEYSKNEGR